MTIIDPIALTRDLIRCPSVTPQDLGALSVLQSALEQLGFHVTRLPFTAPGTEEVDNLFAKLGDGNPHFCFAGHTDVVPAGDSSHWSVDPFAADLTNGILTGRGACDMKGAIGAFVASVAKYIKTHGTPQGTISLLITGDEEGPAINGTRKVLDWLKSHDLIPNHCLVGEPTNPHRLGEMVKIGRRGSLNARLTVTGAQGHVAYPHLADNPVPRMLKLLTQLASTTLDKGTEHFPPSNIEIVTIDVGNSATNVIPASISAGFNIRFNNLHTEESLITWLKEEFDSIIAETGGQYDLKAKASGEAFLTEPCRFTDIVANAIGSVTDQTPELSTSGGTSDARFISSHCPVIEFGLVGQSMHRADEHTNVGDIENLSEIYYRTLNSYFEGSAT